jgi:LysM repeat protein
VFARLAVIALIALVAWASLARPSEGAGSEKVYVVQAHDTLWSIAASHYAGDPRAAVWKLQERNRLDGATIRPGQRLVLPAS